MRKSQKHLKYEAEALEIIKRIPSEKLDRAIFVLKYMSECSIEDGRMLAEYSGRTEVTLDMIVEWVKNKQNTDQSLLQGVV